MWPLDQGIGLCKPGFHSLAASVQCHALVASIPAGWQGLYIYLVADRNACVKGLTHVGHSFPFSYPGTVQLMPQLCVVGSRHKPLSIDPPCFPCGYLYLEAAIIQSPCWLEWEGRMWGVWWRTIPMLIASGVQGVALWFLLHPSVGEAMARS